MKEIVSNKPKVDNKEVVSLENSEGNSPEDTTETVVRNEKQQASSFRLWKTMIVIRKHY